MQETSELVILADTLDRAEIADRVRRALRARVLGGELDSEDLASLSKGINLLERALRATEASTMESYAAVAFSGDARTLRILREVAVDQPFLDTDRLRRLRETLVNVHGSKPEEESELLQAVQLFSRLTRKALWVFQAVQESRSTRVLRELSD